MPNRAKRKARRRARQNTVIKTNILDLPDEVLLKLLQRLGLVNVLNPRTLRTVTSAFQLAQTCKRIFNVFCSHITELNVLLQEEYPPPLYHATHSDAHLRWILRSLSNLNKIQLPPEKSHLTNDVPPTLQLKELVVDGQYDCPPSRRLPKKGNHSDRLQFRGLPKSLTKLCVDNPTPRAMRYLERLHQTPNSCRLKDIRIIALSMAQLEQLRNFFAKCCGEIETFYVSFKLSCDYEQRDGENPLVTDTIEYICSTHDTHAPRLRILTLAVPNRARLDTDWDSSDLLQLQPFVDEARSKNMRNSSLEMMLIFTDKVLLESWMTAVRCAITPTLMVSVEVGRNTIGFVPPLFGLPFPALLSAVRLTTIVQHQFPSISYLRDAAKWQQDNVQFLYISERAVADKYFYHTREHRDATLAYVAAALSFSIVTVSFAFGEWAKRIGIWSEESEDAHQNMNILLGEKEETPEHVAYEFVASILSAVKCVKKLDISFEAVSYAYGNEAMVERLLRNMHDVKELSLVRPKDKYHLQRGEVYVNVTEKFLIGLPVFLHLLTEGCPNIEEVSIENVGEIQWEGDCNEEVLLSTAFEALDSFELQRPDVMIEGVRATLEYWRRLWKDNSVE